MSSDLIRIRIIFVGRVQGVGFRATARGIAAQYSVTGWVRNEPDQTVLMEVQGAGRAVEYFLTDLRSRMSGLIHAEHATSIPSLPGETVLEIRR